MRPALASENPKSIIRRTAIGTTSVATEATMSATSANPIRVRWTNAYGASGLNALSEELDVFDPASAADDIRRAAPEAIRAGYGPLIRLNQGGQQMQADGPSPDPFDLRQRPRRVIRPSTERAAGPSAR